MAISSFAAGIGTTGLVFWFQVMRVGDLRQVEKLEKIKAMRHQGLDAVSHQGDGQGLFRVQGSGFRKEVAARLVP